MRIGWTGIVVVLSMADGCGARATQDAQTSTDPLESRPSPDATDCSVLAPPSATASCSACTSAPASPCQSNGCYNGYWCNKSTLKCRSAPTDCSIGVDSGGGGGGAGGGTSGGDGAITRIACTGNFGNQLSSRFGRLDGTIVSVVAPGGSHTCNGDSGHVHLQIAVKGQTYDVAINTDTLADAVDIGLPGGAWSEGWHTNVSLDYAQLGAHSSAFAASSASAAAKRIETFVANANHVSVFATGYGTDGIHLVHRSSGGKTDGAVIVDPTTPTPHALLFRFSDQSF